MLRIVHFAYMPSPNTPAGLMEFVRSYDSHQLRPSLESGRVGSCITLFEALLKRLLTLRPARSPKVAFATLCTKRLQQSRLPPLLL